MKKPILIIITFLSLMTSSFVVISYQIEKFSDSLIYDDINNDGISEIIIQYSENQISILDIDGSFYDHFKMDIDKIIPQYNLSQIEIQQPGVPEIQPGWPKSVGNYEWSSPTLGNIDGGDDLEIVIGCNDDNVYIWDAYGVSLPNWPQSTEGDVISCPALGDIDGDDELEIVVGSWDHKIYAWNADGTLVDGLWPLTTTGVIKSSPALGDIDQDNDLEIVIACYYGTSATLYALNGDGSSVYGWPLSFNQSIDCTAALGDIDKDGRLEIVVGTSESSGMLYVFNGENATVLDGWPVELYGAITSSPALGDIDNDGNLEIVVGDSFWGGYVWIFDRNGSLVDGWPQYVGNNVIASPALVDFDGDNDLEIVVPTSLYFGSPIPAKMFIFHHNGQVVDNWPIDFTDPNQRIDSSPLVCDIDDDNELEIVVGSCDGSSSPSPFLYAFNYDASLVNDAWPIYDGDTSSSPAAGDIDNDGKLEIIISESEICHCWELGENTYNPEFFPWPMFHHDRLHTGLFGHMIEELKAYAYGPYFGLINEYVQFSGSLIGGYPPYNWEWDLGDTHTSEERNPQHTYTTPGNYSVTLTVTDDTDNTSDDSTWAWIQDGNSPPDKSVVNGPSSGSTGKSYPYTFTTSDPEGLPIWYYMDWDDGTNTSWIGPYNSGITITKSHKWTNQGKYTIKCKAKDPYGDEGPYGEFEVTMPRTKPINTPFQWLQNFLKPHPNLFPIIRQLLGLK